MSVQSPIYIMWGLMLPYPNGDWSEEYEDALDALTDSAFDRKPKEGVTVLIDGMGGKYIAIGHVHARSGPHGDDLGTHTIPNAQFAHDPFHDPVMLASMTKWRTDIEAALKDIGLHSQALGREFGWHVIQHYR